MVSSRPSGIPEELRSDGAPSGSGRCRARRFTRAKMRLRRGLAGTPAPAHSVLYSITVPIAIEHERDNVFRLAVRGTLLKAEFDGCQERLADEITRRGRVRLLFVLEEFKGWEPQANWNDLYFFVKHGGSIERLAIVGDERWRSAALRFAVADLRKGPVKFFTGDALADAQAWLSA
jgi:SpoIIAA-like